MGQYLCSTSTCHTRLTQKRLLAQLLRCSEVLLPLEQCQCLIDQRQHIHATSLTDRLLLHLNSSFEFLHCFLVFLLIQKQLAVIVVDIALITKVLNAASESRHTTGDRTHLVLRDTELNM